MLPETKWVFVITADCVEISGAEISTNYFHRTRKTFFVGCCWLVSLERSCILILATDTFYTIYPENKQDLTYFHGCFQPYRHIDIVPSLIYL